MIQSLRRVVDYARAAVGQRLQPTAAGMSRWAEAPPRAVKDSRRAPQSWIRRNREETQGAWVRWR